MSNSTIKKEEVKYSKILSSLFCSMSIIVLSFLSLLNNLSLDIYSATTLLKIVTPAALCFWFIGKIIGTIFDSYNKKIVKVKIKNEKHAYEIPSMFSSDVNNSDDENDGVF